MRAKEEFTLEGARGYAALAPPDDEGSGLVPMAYFRGARITKVGDITNIHHGRLTTCPRDHPHYYIKAKRIKFDAGERRFIVYGAKVHLYGLTIPLLPWIKVGLKAGGTGHIYSADTARIQQPRGLLHPRPHAPHQA